MRYPASEKLESEPLMRSPLGAIGSSPMGDGSSTMASRTVEASHLPVRQTLAMLGIPSTTYYRPLSADLPCKSPAGQWDMTDGRKAGLARSRTGRPARALYGTASRMRPVPTSSSLRWNMRI
jgi:hypothetical protein